MRTYKKITVAFILLLLTSASVMAQPFPQAEPAVIDITRLAPANPLPPGTDISGNAILKFRVANNSTGNQGNGTIPARALDYTVQFNPFYTYQSLVTTSQFAVTFASRDADSYVVHLTNSVPILPGDVFDFYLNVKATQSTVNPAGETVTINVDRTLPIACGNTTPENDNIAKTFKVGLVVPVKLLTLSGVLNNNLVDLEWTTTDEINLSSFDLERSTDGVHFSAITNKSAVGNTTGETDYTHQDNIQQLAAGILYYRVKAKDSNGDFAYSKNTTIKLSKGVGVTVYPSPFTDQVNLQIMTSSNAKGMVRLYNSAGIAVKSREVSLSAGMNTIKVDGLEKLAQGIYMVEITIGGEKVFSGKLLK